MTKLLLTGCFDIMHIGHMRMLKYAASICDTLIVAIDSDEKTKKDKGENRPFNEQNIRKEFLENIKGITEVLIFNSDTELEELCNDIRPDIRLVGSDWKGKNIVGQQYCKKIIYFDRVGDYSTTNILERR